MTVGGDGEARVAERGVHAHRHAEGDPQRFRLSHGVMKLSHVWLKGLDVVALARSIVEGLREATGDDTARRPTTDDEGKLNKTIDFRFTAVEVIATADI